METVDKLSDSQHNKPSVSATQSVTAHPQTGISGTGKSVGYALSAGVLYWFPIRATHHRAQKVYERLVELRNDRLTPYLPTQCRIEYSNEDVDHPTQQVKEEPLDGGLLFVVVVLDLLLGAGRRREQCREEDEEGPFHDRNSLRAFSR